MSFSLPLQKEISLLFNPRIQVADPRPKQAAAEDAKTMLRSTQQKRLKMSKSLRITGLGRIRSDKTYTVKDKSLISLLAPAPPQATQTRSLASNMSLSLTNNTLLSR